MVNLLLCISSEILKFMDFLILCKGASITKDSMCCFGNLIVSTFLKKNIHFGITYQDSRYIMKYVHQMFKKCF